MPNQDRFHVGMPPREKGSSEHPFAPQGRENRSGDAGGPVAPNVGTHDRSASSDPDAKRNR